jgi:hypothetical protein
MNGLLDRRTNFQPQMLPYPNICIRFFLKLELYYTCTPHPPSSSFYNKKIGFKEKIVSDVTSETVFSLKSIFLKKMGRQRVDEGCISSISP